MPWPCSRLTIGGVTPDAHTLLFSSLRHYDGLLNQSFSPLSATSVHPAVNEGLHKPKDLRIDRFFKSEFTWNAVLAVGALAFLAGLILVGSSRVAVEGCRFD